MCPATLTHKHVENLLKLEEEMYWLSGKWKDLWEKEAKYKFRNFIDDYITHFPEGCIGFENNGEVVGALFLTKISEIRTIPYIHEFHQYYEPAGNISYVSFFVVKDNDKNIAIELYNRAKRAATDIGCKKIIVVIYRSPLEEKIIRDQGYKIVDKSLGWEIYPKINVSSRIWYLNIKKV